jgi:hypothetical protein
MLQTMARDRQLGPIDLARVLRATIRVADETTLG